uniref:Uncharacterized protein n=1 Tax=Arundo donax TaxID=35708 RepID=A0A0A9C3K9_ARUDO
MHTLIVRRRDVLSVAAALFSFSASSSSLSLSLSLSLFSVDAPPLRSMPCFNLLVASKISGVCHCPIPIRPSLCVADVLGPCSFMLQASTHPVLNSCHHHTPRIILT